MLFSFQLLKQFVTLEMNYVQVFQLLTRQGFEVESHTLRGYGDTWNRVVFAQVLAAEPHPQAQKLKVCQVDCGKHGVVQIVCGAPNVTPGMGVAAALPGAQLPGGVCIAPTVLRGVPSGGMLCGRDELGLCVQDGESEGLWALDIWDAHDALGSHGARVMGMGNRPGALRSQLGEPLFETLGIQDVLFEVGITPNRPDVMSHKGLAREVVAGLRRCETNGLDPLACLGEPRFLSAPLDWVNHIRHGCLHESCDLLGTHSRFFANSYIDVPAFFLSLKEVTVQNSPFWLRDILERIGVTSVNNVVDVGNLVTVLLGQPSHFFDSRRILEQSVSGNEGRKGAWPGSQVPSEGTQFCSLTLRKALSGEVFLGLDAKVRHLETEDCVVATGEGAVALLGVLGGETTKVTEDTHAVVVEFAFPRPVDVRRTSRRHGKKTDSSFLFEKGIDATQRCAAAASLVRLLAYVGAVSFGPPDAVTEGAWDWSEGSIGVCGTLREGTSHDSSGLSAETGQGNLKGAQTKTPSQDLKTHVLPLPEQGHFSAKGIVFSERSAERILGCTLIDFSDQLVILEDLGFRCSEKTLDSQVAPYRTVEVFVPSWRRQDVTSEACLVEEIARMVGMDKVNPVPLIAPVTLNKDDTHLDLFRKCADFSVSCGYYEVAGLHFMGKNDLDRLTHKSDACGKPIALLNPLSQDEPFLQTSLIPDLLRKVAHNLRYGIDSGQLFHLSRTFCSFEESRGLQDLFDYDPGLAQRFVSEKDPVKNRPHETPRWAGVAFGPRFQKDWTKPDVKEWVLHDILGHIVGFLRSQNKVLCQALRVNVLPLSHPWNNVLHPHERALLSVDLEGFGQGAVESPRTIKSLYESFAPQASVPLGWCARLLPRVCAEWGVSNRTFCFEINMSALHKCVQILDQLARQIPSVGQSSSVTQDSAAPLGKRFPLMRRDFAWVVPSDLPVGRLLQETQVVLKTLQGNMGFAPGDVRVFDVYEGPHLAAGQKSVGIQICFEPLMRTLSEEDLQNLQALFVSHFSVTLGASLRGA